MTTEQLTPQSLFDIVWKRAKDPRKAISSDGECLYRGGGEDGSLCCFVGAAIPDSLYDPAYERKGAWKVAEAHPERFADLGRLMGMLQSIHDDCDPEEWEGELRWLASSRGLKVPTD